jgi:hypothetical protein
LRPLFSIVDVTESCFLSSFCLGKSEGSYMLMI